MELEWLESGYGAKLYDISKRWRVMAYVSNVVTGWECQVPRQRYTSLHPTKEEAMAMAVAIVRMQ